MNPVKISFSDSAVEDLLAIRAWYAEQGVPEVGQQFVSEIMKRIGSLADFPDMGRVLSEFDRPFLREIVHSPYRIVYRRDDQRARIVRIWRSERLLRLPPTDG